MEQPELQDSAVVEAAPQPTDQVVDEDLLEEEPAPVDDDIEEELDGVKVRGKKDAVEKLKAEGMEFNEVDRPAFVAAVAPIWESEAATFGPDLMALMDAARK